MDNPMLSFIIFCLVNAFGWYLIMKGVRYFQRKRIEKGIYNWADWNSREEYEQYMKERNK